MEQPVTRDFFGHTAEKSQTVYMPVVIKSPTFNGFATARSISSSSIQIDAFGLFKVGDEVEVEFKSNYVILGLITAARAGRVWITSVSSFDLEKIAIPQNNRDNIKIARAPRLNIECSGAIYIRHAKIICAVRDISMRGCRLIASGLSEGDVGIIETPIFEPKRAEVRWSRLGENGLLFSCPLSLKALKEISK